MIEISFPTWDNFGFEWDQVTRNGYMIDAEYRYTYILNTYVQTYFSRGQLKA